MIANNLPVYLLSALLSVKVGVLEVHFDHLISRDAEEKFRKLPLARPPDPMPTHKPEPVRSDVGHAPQAEAAALAGPLETFAAPMAMGPAQSHVKHFVLATIPFGYRQTTISLDRCLSGTGRSTDDCQRIITDVTLDAVRKIKNIWEKEKEIRRHRSTKKHPFIIWIVGHASDDGMTERNLEVAKRRAEAVRANIIRQIAANKLKEFSDWAEQHILLANMGALSPIYRDGGYDEAGSRRVEIIVGVTEID